nr:MAG TPA: bacteriocin [Caudoviricetes sp.]
MNTKEYIKQWIENTLGKFPKNVFKYVLYEDQLHIIKYSDELKHNKDFINSAYILVKSFKQEFNEDIVILNDSDDYFMIDAFDIVSMGYNKMDNPISLQHLRTDISQLFNIACGEIDNSYALAA